MDRPRSPFARVPSGRFWEVPGLSVLAAWGPWWAAMGYEASRHFCPECRGVMAAFAALGPAVPGFVLARPLELGEGRAAVALCVTSGAAFVAALTAAGRSLPRGRWGVWAVAAGTQGWLAWAALGLIRM